MGSLLTLAEAADYLRISRDSLYKMAQERRIPASRVGRQWRFHKEVLDEWLRAQARAVRKTILVADSDPSLVSLLCEILSREGHEAVGVTSGSEAVEQVRQGRFDLLFIDVALPKMDGVETVRAIRQLDPFLNVVIVTSQPEHDSIRATLSLGPLVVLRKPVKLNDVIRVVNMLSRVDFPG